MTAPFLDYMKGEAIDRRGIGPGGGITRGMEEATEAPLVVEGTL